MTDHGLVTVLGLGLLLFLLSVFGLHAFLFSGIQRDELEALGEAQAWRWAYDPEHPPIVAWIFMALVELFGPSKWVTATYKTATFAALSLFSALIVAQVTRDRLAVAAAAFAPLATVALGFQALIFLTHSMLLIAALAGLVAAIACLAREATPKWYHFLFAGCAIALGVGAKHIFAIPLVALAIGVLLDPEMRARLRHPQAFWLVPPVLAGAFAVWVGMAEGISGMAGVVPGAAEEKQIRWASWAGKALVFLAVKPFALAAPFFALTALLSWRGFVGALFGRTEGTLGRMRRLLLRAIAICVAVWAVILIVHPTLPLRSHYLIALVLLVTLWTSLLLADLSRPRLRLLSALCLVIGFGGLANAVVGTVVMPCDRCLQQLPVKEIADQIAEDGFVPGTIVSDSADWGTNLRTAFPEARLLVRDHPHIRPLPTAPGRVGGCLLVLHPVWHEETVDELIAFAAERTGAVIDPSETTAIAQAPMVYGGREDVRLQYILIAEGTGDCR